MKEKRKPKYNIAQNVGWMVKIAWKTRKRVLFFCVAMAALEILYNLTQLYIAPEILSRVEQHTALGALFGTIGFFTLALFLTMGLKDYLKQIVIFPRVDVRSSIIGMIGRKCNMTSFPNTLNADFIKLREKAHMATEGNREATELIWQTLTELLQNIGGFLVYLTILSYLDWRLSLPHVLWAFWFPVMPITGCLHIGKQKTPIMRKRLIFAARRNRWNWQRISVFSACRTGCMTCWTASTMCI